MYQAHYRSIVRIAALLAGDVQAAEDIAQDSFVAMHGSWSRLRDYDKGLSFLLQFVVSRSRLILRQPPVAGPVAGPGRRSNHRMCPVPGRPSGHWWARPFGPSRSGSERHSCSGSTWISRTGRSLPRCGSAGVR